jgi:UDP-N-acetylmuramyl tripeptide synthase
MVEVELERGETAARAERDARRTLKRVFDALGRRRAPMTVRRFRGGLAFFVPATIDALSATLDVLEWVITHPRASDAEIERGSPELERAFRDESNPRLVALHAEAVARRVPFLVDDERVTVGHAAHARTFPLRRIPRTIPWRALHAIPVALVTGTNGKTTTTRLVARIAKHAGLRPGNTSSDGTAIDEIVVDRGDNTGGESARAVLRDRRVQIAILETARGGLLRRGLAVTNVDAALITNVTADHLGEHGVLDVKTLVDTKAVVGGALKKGGRLVLGADDPQLRRIAPRFPAERVLFALDPKHVSAHVARGGHAFLVEGGAIVHAHRRTRESIVRIHEIPITDAGRAPHNVKNALAAAALAWSLGLSRDAIAAGLRSFGMKDNPGRGAVLDVDGVRVVLDFGHNPAAAAALYAWARRLAGAGCRVTAVLTQPGDRDDDAMDAFARSVVRAGATRVIVWEGSSLLRGRAKGEIVRQLARSIRSLGLRAERALSEADAVRRALARSKPGDVIVVSPSLDRALPAHEA